MMRKSTLLRSLATAATAGARSGVVQRPLTPVLREAAKCRRGYVSMPARVANAGMGRRFYSTENASEAEKKEEAKEEKKDDAAAEGKDLAKELETVKAELEKVKAESADFKDKWTRTVAEYHNLQERTKREVKQAKDFALQRFAKDLVESIDNLERALGTVPQESLSPEKNKELFDFYEGLKMTEEIMLKTLAKHGLERFDPMGHQFDPNKHEATFHLHMPDKEPNTVFHVQQKGFILNGRTLRAAQVGVTKAAP